MVNQTDGQVIIRRALDDDADAIIGTHHEAVHTIAWQNYEQNILNEWAPPLTPEHVANHRVRIKEGRQQSVFLVAELDDKIIGFGMFEPSTDELSAVYVSPAAGRKGIGAKILRELENIARDLGAKKIWLKASLNAEKFYLRHNFIREGMGEHTFKSGLRMPCVLMHKYL